jgi:anti-sigma factor RsiW
MKDHRFIELVNLYIDRQISAEETAELEAEIQASPQRRAVYRQYCQLHSATKQVYESFRTNAEPQTHVPAGRVINGDFARRPRSNWIHYAGGLAAAACLALAFVRYNAGSSSATDDLAQAATTPAAQVAVVTPTAPVTVAPAAAAPVATLASLKDNLSAEPDYAAMLAALRREEQRAFANGEIQSSRLPSLFDDGVFDARQFAPANNQRTFRGKQTPAQQAEFTAFQFQR